MHPGVVFGCIAAIAVGVAIIMYTVLRTPKDTAKFGNRPSIDLVEDPNAPDEEITELPTAKITDIMETETE